MGFRLSVAATAALVTLQRPIARHLPGPRWLAVPLATVLAAQIGTTPLLLSMDASVSVASIPANLLAVPVAGWVMVWGLTAGLVAGLVSAPLASALHWPTGIALSWLELVANRAAHARLGELHLHHLAVLAGGLALIVAAGWRRGLRRVGGGLAVAAMAAAVLTAHAPPPLRTSLATGVVRWHAGDVDVVVLGGAGGRASLSTRAVLEALRRAGVGTIDLLVVADPSVPEDLVATVHRAHPVGATRTPAGGAAVMEIGALRVSIVSVPGRLVVDAVPRGP
jgi:hypothetical protein